MVHKAIQKFLITMDNNRHLLQNWNYQETLNFSKNDSFLFVIGGFFFIFLFYFRSCFWIDFGMLGQLYIGIFFYFSKRKNVLDCTGPKSDIHYQNLVYLEIPDFIDCGISDLDI